MATPPLLDRPSLRSNDDKTEALLQRVLNSSVDDRNSSEEPQYYPALSTYLPWFLLVNCQALAFGFTISFTGPTIMDIIADTGIMPGCRLPTNKHVPSAVPNSSPSFFFTRPAPKENQPPSFGSASTTTAACVLSCTSGAACATGSDEPGWCAPGSFANATGMPICTRCAAGSFQGGEGATACLECTEHSWCGEGSSAPTPCEAGTVGRLRGLSLGSSTTPASLHHHTKGFSEGVAVIVIRRRLGLGRMCIGIRVCL